MSFGRKNLIFFIKRCRIAVGPQQQAFGPRRRAAHLFTNCIQRHAGISFDDNFIVNMHDNRTVAECLHSVAKNITSSGLHDVFDKFWTVGIKTFPLLGASDAFIGNTLTTEFIRPNLRFHICQFSSRWESDKKHTASAGEGKTIV